jgi:hypothetical protein
MNKPPDAHHAPFSFILPDALSAKEPPEVRGIARDRVRLKAAVRDALGANAGAVGAQPGHADSDGGDERTPR